MHKITAEELKAAVNEYFATHTDEEIQKDLDAAEKRVSDAPPEWKEMIEKIMERFQSVG